MSDVEVRAARPEELADVGALTVAAYRADGHLPPDDPYAVVLADTTRRAVEADLLVAVGEPGRLLGTVTVCDPGTPLAEISRPGELEFRMLAVDPAARGRGVGAALVEAVVAHARERGCRRVVLSSLSGMRSAHALYHRFGFRRAPHRDWSEHPLLAFELDLAP